MYCYYFRVLQQYNASMDFAVEVPAGYAHVPQPAPGARLRCKCRKRKDRKSKHPAPAAPRAGHSPDGSPERERERVVYSRADGEGSDRVDPDTQWSGPLNLAPGAAAEL